MQDWDQKKMKCLIWFKIGTGQPCNRVVEILQISLGSAPPPAYST